MAKPYYKPAETKKTMIEAALHLSQKLAGLLGARISLERQYGAGSRFTVSITG